MKQILVTEQNPFADIRKSNNGGGYSQPLAKFKMGSHILTIDDSSCGDFGRRYTVSYDDIVIYDRNDIDGCPIFEKSGYSAILRLVASKFGYCTRRKDNGNL